MNCGDKAETLSVGDKVKLKVKKVKADPAPIEGC